VNAPIVEYSVLKSSRDGVGMQLSKVPALQSVQYADTLKMGKTLSEILTKNKVLKSKLRCDIAASFIASTLAVAATHWLRSTGRKDLNSLISEVFATVEQL
jgi:hypothetical protein